MKQGDLVYPWSYNDDYSVALYLCDYKTWNYGIECKIFCGGKIIIIPKRQLRAVNEER